MPVPAVRVAPARAAPVRSGARTLSGATFGRRVAPCTTWCSPWARPICVETKTPPDEAAIMSASERSRLTVLTIGDRSVPPITRSRDSPRSAGRRSSASQTPQYYRGIAPRPDKLRVLTVIDTPAVTGGAEKVAVDIATNLDPDRYESSFCALRSAGRQRWRIDDLEESGVTLHQIDAQSMKDVRALKRFVGLVRRGAYDVVHAHLWDAHVWSALAMRRASVSILIAHEHSWEFEGKRARQILDRVLVAPRADAFVAVSRANQEKMLRLGLPAPKIHHIPNGIAWSGGPADGAGLRAE